MEVRLRIHAHSDHAHPDGVRPERAHPDGTLSDRHHPDPAHNHVLPDPARHHAHPSDDTVEEYAFDRLPEGAVAVLEEHLLICETCQDRLRDVDEYLLLMKTVMARYADDPMALRTPTGRLWERFWNSAALGKSQRESLAKPVSRAAWACGLALILSVSWLTAPVLWRTDRITPPATITLAALRGGDGETVARGPAHRPLDLSIDLTDLPAAPGYRLELVTSTGGHAWGGMAHASGDKLSAFVEQGLRAGMYWARLYSARGELLREFGLRVD